MSHRPLVVCFGDSLTAGYQSPSADWPAIRETPYGGFLQQRLGPDVEVRTSGICGEVTTEMIRRFGRDVLQLRPAYVVILGGTNDLGWNAEPDTIMEHLHTMYQQAHVCGIVPVAVAVPSIRDQIEDAGPIAPWVHDHIARRQELNRQIVECSRRMKIACVDLFTATAEPGTGRLAAAYSNDGLHLTTAGYQRLADLLYEQVFAAAFASHKEME